MLLSIASGGCLTCPRFQYILCQSRQIVNTVHTPPWLAFVAQLVDNIKHCCPARRHQQACEHEAAEAEDVEATLRTCRTTCTRTIAAMRMTRSSMLLWPPRRRPLPHDSLLRNMPLDPGQCVHRMTLCSPSRVWLYIVHIYIYMYIYTYICKYVSTYVNIHIYILIHLHEIM